MNRKLLNELKEKYSKELEIRISKDYKGIDKQILVCGGTGCTSNHSKEIIDELNKLIKNINQKTSKQ